MTRSSIVTNVSPKIISKRSKLQMETKEDPIQTYGWSELIEAWVSKNPQKYAANAAWLIRNQPMPDFLRPIRCQFNFYEPMVQNPEIECPLSFPVKSYIMGDPMPCQQVDWGDPYLQKRSTSTLCRYSWITGEEFRGDDPKCLFDLTKCNIAGCVEQVPHAYVTDRCTKLCEGTAFPQIVTSGCDGQSAFCVCQR